jgi:glycosyltransferase involved in cell wall biosynthesis
MKTLYLCYFGLREPLAQTQALPYLRELGRGGVDVNLLTFEPGWPHSWTEEERLDWQARLREDGINWKALAYHKKPSLPATLYDIAAGSVTAARIARRQKIDVLHARAHIPLVMALLAQRLCGGKCRIVFDIRGLIADEYVDAGVWKEDSLVYKAIKWVERIGVRKADQVVVLTEALFDWLVENLKVDPAKIEVIPCCVDFSRFPDEAREIEAGSPSRFEVVYAGSVTGLYMLEEMGKFFLALRERYAGENAYLRILTTSSAGAASERLRQVGLRQEDFRVGAASPAEASYYLSRAKVSLSFRKATFSQIAASPTKIPEYLAAGLPVISNAGIGDTDQILLGDRVGVIVRDFTRPAYDQAISQLEDLLSDPELPRRCRRCAHERFDLERVGGERYRRLYQKLFLSAGARVTPLGPARW